MLNNILSPEVQKFIRDHENDDEKLIVLKQKNISGIPSHIIADQIAGRKKAKEKLPLYYTTPRIIYPPSVNLEQSSSEQTASLKSTLLSRVLNLPLRPNHQLGQGVDLTGGLGIDTFFLSKLFSQVSYVEPDLHLLEIARHNHQQLGATNILYQNTTAEKYLESLDQPVDMIFIDPSRRTKNKKVFSLKESDPDIISLQSAIFGKTRVLLIKASPMLDIKQAIKELIYVKTTFVVAVENEVRELLFLCEKNFDGEPQIEAINLTSGDVESLTFNFSEENDLTVQFCDPLLYLYEPNASIMKGGAFKSITKHFQLNKIQSSTHLYSAEKYFKNFPGRIFKIEAFVKPDIKQLKQYLPDLKANIITRNYPLSVDELKKKTKLRDGGEKYLIGFSGIKEKFLVIANRVR